MEDEYRAYREVIAAGIGVLRPNVEVATSGLGALEEEAVRLDPHVVVSSQPEPPHAGGGRAWVELHPDPTRPMKVSCDGHHMRSSDPTLEALLAVIDEVEEAPGTEKPLAEGRP